MEERYTEAVERWAKDNMSSAVGATWEPAIRKDGLQDGYHVRLTDGTELNAYEFGGNIRIRRTA